MFFLFVMSLDADVNKEFNSSQKRGVLPYLNSYPNKFKKYWKQAVFTSLI